MSAPPFFQLTGRGDLKFWGEDDRPTIVVWESLSDLEQEQLLEKMGKLKDWVVCAGRGKKTKSNTRLKSMEKKSSRSSASKPNPQQERRWIRKEAKGSKFTGKCGGNRVTSNAQ